MKGSVFVLTAVLLAVTSVGVPYLFFTESGSFMASFLFWTVLTLAVIVAAAVYTRRWREQ